MFSTRINAVSFNTSSQHCHRRITINTRHIFAINEVIHTNTGEKNPNTQSTHEFASIKGGRYYHILTTVSLYCQTSHLAIILMPAVPTISFQI